MHHGDQKGVARADVSHWHQVKVLLGELLLHRPELFIHGLGLAGMVENTALRIVTAHTASLVLTVIDFLDCTEDVLEFMQYSLISRRRSSLMTL